MNKKCFRCNEIKPLIEFYKHKEMTDGHVNKCKECNKKDVRENYINNIEQKRAYELYRNRYNINRLFSNRYAGIKIRSTSLKLNIVHGYSCYGKEYLNREEWLSWCFSEENYKKFMVLYNNWVQSNFDEKLSPSVDRIDNNKGYKKSNLQWLTKSENSTKHKK